MRTTVNLDDQTYELATVYASARGITLGNAIAELIRRADRTPSDAFEAQVHVGANGIPVLRSRGRKLTSEMVKAFEEDEFG